MVLVMILTGVNDSPQRSGLKMSSLFLETLEASCRAVFESHSQKEINIQGQSVNIGEMDSVLLSYLFSVFLLGPSWEYSLKVIAVNFGHQNIYTASILKQKDYTLHGWKDWALCRIRMLYINREYTVDRPPRLVPGPGEVPFRSSQGKTQAPSYL